MGPEGWRWGVAGQFRFFLGMEENIYGEKWTRARDTVKLSWLGLEADMPSLVGGHKATVEGNTVEAPDQDKDLGRTMSLLSGKALLTADRVTGWNPACGTLHSKGRTEASSAPQPQRRVSRGCRAQRKPTGMP